MRLKSVTITNIKAIEYLRFEPGTFTLLEGRNGVGKSSVLDAIRAPFEGGHDSGWLRKGAKKGTVELLLDDGHTLKATVTPTGTKHEVLSPDGTAVPEPRTFIKQMADILAVDPLRLLNPSLKPKEIADELLKVLPLKFLGEELQECLGGFETPAQQNFDASLVEFEKIRDAAYQRRKLCNANLKTAEATIKRLRETMAPDEDTDWQQRSEAYQTLVDRLASELNERTLVVRNDARDAAECITRTFDRQIRELEQKKAEALEKLRQEIGDAIKQLVDEFSAARLEAQQALAVAKEKAAVQERQAGAKATIARMEEELRPNFLESERLSDTLAKLDALKRSKLAALPIPGLAFEDGEMLIDGVSWPHVNTARKIDVALQFAVLKGATFIVADDFEHLDAEMLEAVKAGAQALNLQIVAAVVDRSERVCLCGHGYALHYKTYGDCSADACRCHEFRTEEAAQKLRITAG